MKLNYSKKVFILAVIILLGILVLDVIFINLLLNKIYEINNKIKQSDISSQLRLKELSLKDLVTTSEYDRERLQRYFVGAGDTHTLEFTKYLENLAREMGVTEKKSVGYEEAVGFGSSDTVSAIRYRFNISGKWSNVYSFLKAIENLPKVSYLNSVNFNLSQDAIQINTSGKIWTADIDFSVLKLKN